MLFLKYHNSTNDFKINVKIGHKIILFWLLLCVFEILLNTNFFKNSIYELFNKRSNFWHIAQESLNIVLKFHNENKMSFFSCFDWLFPILITKILELIKDEIYDLYSFSTTKVNLCMYFLTRENWIAQTLLFSFFKIILYLI